MACRMLLQKALVLCLLALVTSHDEQEEHHVTIREVSQSSQQASPDDLHVQFTLNGKDVNLRLKRNAKVDVNAPVTFEDGKDPRGKAKKKQHVDLYQDKDNFATISAKSFMEDGTYRRELHGSFEHGDNHFTLEPKEGGHVARKRKLQKVKGKKGTYPMLLNFDHKKRQHRKPEETLDRKRRSTSAPDYHVEIQMVIDHTVWQLFMKKANNDADLATSEIQYHFSHILNGMDLVFSGIQADLDGYTVSLWLKGFHIAKTYSSSKWADGTVLHAGFTPEDTIVNPSGILRNMRTWSHESGTGWNNPDHHMLWTRYDLNGPTIGIAYNGGICNGAAVSVIEFFDFHGWQVAAHELGHNLGAPHDNSTSCSVAKGNVMMPSVGTTQTLEKASNAYKFSACSINYMRNTIQGNIDGFPRLCLTDNDCSHQSTSLQKYPGEKYSLDEQCRLRRDDPTSQACNAGQENLCRELQCSAPSTQCWSYYRQYPGAADGSPCGDGKWCMQSKCITKTTSPSQPCVSSSLDTTVPSGCMDHSWYSLRFNTGEEFSCDQIPTMFPSFCYDDQDVATFCCGSCRRAGIVNPAGLDTASCTDWTNNMFYLNDANGQLLLDTCAGYAAAGLCPGLYYSCCASCLKTP